MKKQKDLFVGIPECFECSDFLDCIGEMCSLGDIPKTLTALNIPNDPFFCSWTNLREAISSSVTTKNGDFRPQLRGILLKPEMDEIIKLILVAGNDNKENIITKSKYKRIDDVAKDISGIYIFINNLLNGFTKLAKAPICDKYESTLGRKKYHSFFPVSKHKMAIAIKEKLTQYFEIIQRIKEQIQENHIAGITDDRLYDQALALLINSIHIGFAFFVLHGVDFSFDHFDKVLSEVANKDYSKVDDNDFELSGEVKSRFKTVVAHFAQNAGIIIDKTINPELFCPIYDESSNAIYPNLFEAIKHHDREHILIQAEGGLGKTYQTFFAVNKLLESDILCAYIPGYSEYNKELQTSAIIHKISALYLNRIIHTDNEAYRVFSTFKDKPLIIFIDGFNETSDTSFLSDEIRKVSTMIPNVIFVVASRANDPAFMHFRRFIMHGLTTNTVNKLLSSSKCKYSVLPPNLQELLLSPMFLVIYLGIGNVNKKVDTAAELLDRYRLDIITYASKNHPTHAKTIKDIMTNHLPNFALQQYDRDKRLVFSEISFISFLKDALQDKTEYQFAVSFLAKNHIVIFSEESGECRFIHEHFRDFWVAYAIKEKIVSSTAISSKPYFSWKIVTEVFTKKYSKIIFQYMAQLEWDSYKSNFLTRCLDSLRISSVREIDKWDSSQTAKATATIIDVLSSLTRNELIEFNFSALNLSLSHFQDVVTGNKFSHSFFTSSIITDTTFFSNTHEGAPRRAEVLKMFGQEYLITISDIDLLISHIYNKSIIPLSRYLHSEHQKNPLHLKTIVSSASLGEVVFAIDSQGKTFYWQFEQLSEGHIACKEKDGYYAREVLQNKIALKAIKYNYENEESIAIICSDATISSFYFESDGSKVYMDAAIKKLPTAINPSRCYCYSDQMDAFYYAIQVNDEIKIMQYYADTESIDTLCTIANPNLSADIMECISNTQSGESLILSCYSPQSTCVFQINLPCCQYYRDGRYYLLNWFKNQSFYGRKSNSDYYISHRINSIEAHLDEMFLSTNDGSVFHFSFDHVCHEYKPSTLLFEMKITDSRFPIEHAICIDNRNIVALCVDRSIRLLDSYTNYMLGMILGNNNGLRKLCLTNTSHVFATSYDGCLLELNPKGEEMICINKTKIGQWCWSVVLIDNSNIVVGYIGGLSLYNYKTDQITQVVNCIGYKVEDLHYDKDEGILYAAENTEGSSEVESRVSCYEVKGYGNSLKINSLGYLPQTKGLNCYGIIGTVNKIYMACSDYDRIDPKIIIIDRIRHTTKCFSRDYFTLSLNQQLYGRYRGIQVFDHYIVCCGPSIRNQNDNLAIINIWDIQDEDNPTMVTQLLHSSISILRVALYANSDNDYLLAAIDTSSKGKLYKYSIHIDNIGSITFSEPQTIIYDHSLCDVSFSNDGNLYVTDLTGKLWKNKWNEDNSTVMFSNIGGFLTSSSNMCSRYKPISSASPIGKALMAFNNTIEEKKREKIEV